MSPFVPFLVAGVGECACGLLLPGWLAWPFYWTGLATLWASLAYFLNRPDLLGKRGSVMAFLPLLPFLLFTRGVAFVGTRVIRHSRIEVVPGLWVGGWPLRGAPGLAQLDLTAELPRRGAALRYACVPMLDGAAARPEDWHAAVEQAVAWRREGLPVLVHCAYGHGRSVAVVIGVLVAEGRADRWEDAHARVLALRPRARMTSAQRRMLTTQAPGLANKYAVRSADLG